MGKRRLGRGRTRADHRRKLSRRLGVKKALTSAWRAAIVANTCLKTPSMARHAMDFHAGRERDVYRECRRRAAVFFHEASAAHDDPFWAARAGSVAAGAEENETPS